MIMDWDLTRELRPLRCVFPGRVRGEIRRPVGEQSTAAYHMRVD
jgi:hypothetical protein